MLQVKKGQPAAFETLMHKYYKRILNFIYRIVGDRQAAEDLTQEVFIRVYQSAPRYHPKARFQTWIFTIAKNLSLNEVRNRRRKSGISLQEEIKTPHGDMVRQIEDPGAVHAGDKLAGQEKQALVREAVHSLPENQRMAVLLRRYEGFSYEEIAGTLQCSVSAVKSLLNRAKENLKERLKSVIKDYE